MSMGFTTHKHLYLCADDEEPTQMIIRPGWDAPHVRCLPRTFCAWPCLLRQVGTVLGSSCDCIVTGITYANPGSRQFSSRRVAGRRKLRPRRGYKPSRDPQLAPIDADECELRSSASKTPPCAMEPDS